MSEIDATTFQDFLRKTTNFFVQILIFVKNGTFKFWFISLIVLAIVGGTFYYNANKTHTYYTARSSYIFNFLHKKVYGDLIDYASQLNEVNDPKALSELLKISNRTASSLMRVEAKNIALSPLHEDFTDTKVPFYIFVDVTDARQLSVLQSAFTNYLNNDSTTNNFVAKETKEITKKLEFIEGEMTYLDSLKANLGENELANFPTIMGKAQEYATEKIRLENRLASPTAVTLLQPFKPVKVTRAAQLTRMAVKFISIWLLISLTITTFLYWYKHAEDEI